MIERIYKYTLKAETSQLLELPAGAEILSAAAQDDQLVVYAKVNPEAEETNFYMVWVFGTGHDIDPAIWQSRIPHFLGTVKMLGGSLMWHVFAEK